MSGASHFSHGWKICYSAAALLGLFFINAPAWAADEPTPSAINETPTAEDVSPTVSGRVARAIFTTAMVDREPTDDVKTLPNSTGRVYFFSDLRELAGQIVTHRWEYKGELMAEVTFKVGAGVRWRVYSSKNLLPEWTGTWTVLVNNENDQTLQRSSFEYTAAAAVE